MGIRPEEGKKTDGAVVEAGSVFDEGVLRSVCWHLNTWSDRVAFAAVCKKWRTLAGELWGIGRDPDLDKEIQKHVKWTNLCCAEFWATLSLAPAFGLLLAAAPPLLLGLAHLSLSVLSLATWLLLAGGGRGGCRAEAPSLLLLLAAHNLGFSAHLDSLLWPAPPAPPALPLRLPAAAVSGVHLLLSSLWTTFEVVNVRWRQGVALVLGLRAATLALVHFAPAPAVLLCSLALASVPAAALWVHLVHATIGEHWLYRRVPTRLPHNVLMVRHNWHVLAALLSAALSLGLHSAPAALLGLSRPLLTVLCGAAVVHVIISALLLEVK
ncbi:hypothetical protein Pelo_7672 [Pelomyxa schiedti]|nr:hypothetical protein Pelo_7672 [Pelomyxa schiedti]